MHHAVRATWREVDARRERGEERWGGLEGEVGFWRRFVEEVFGRSGGTGLPEPLLEGLVAHFREDKHWKVYPETHEVLSALHGAGMTLLVVSNWDSTLPSLLERLGLLAFLPRRRRLRCLRGLEALAGDLRRGRPPRGRPARGTRYTWAIRSSTTTTAPARRAFMRCSWTARGARPKAPKRSARCPILPPRLLAR